MTRVLVVGVGDFPDTYLSEKDRLAGRVAFVPLPSVEGAVRAVASAMNRAGVVTGGDPLLEPDRETLLTAWRNLRKRSAADEPLVMHFAGHGVQPSQGGPLYLAPRYGDPADDELDDTCVSFDQLLTAAENGGRPVLFLLDVCGAGQAVTQQLLSDLLARRPQGAPRNAWVIGACTAEKVTYGARFSTATATVVGRIADGTMDVSPALAHIPLDTLAEAIHAEMDSIDRAAGQPRQSVVRTPHTHAVVDPQPFLRNPAHNDDPQAHLLSGMDRRLRDFALGCAPGLDPLHFATRAAGNPTADAVQFSGRTAQLARIEAWVNDTDRSQGRLLVVTGSPGAGKSALLGVTVCMAHPELAPLRTRVRAVLRGFRPSPRGGVVAVHARGLTVPQIISSLVHQLRRSHAAGADPGAVRGTEPVGGRQTDGEDGSWDTLRQLAQSEDLLVVVDALDEAADPAAVLSEVLLPLSDGAPGGEGAACRVLLGTRPWPETLAALAPYLAARPDAVLDLDPSSDEERRTLAQDLGQYLDQALDGLLPEDDVRQIADSLAQVTDSGAFLVAALYADHLRSHRMSSPGRPPRDLTEAFDLNRADLARAEPWIEPVLAVLGRAQGQGMPLDLLHAAALAHAPAYSENHPTPQIQDTRRALAKAAFYLRSVPDTDERLLYRYFHRALADHMASKTDAADLHRALMEAVPRTEHDAPDWRHARPYLVRHAAEHAVAAGGGALDRLLEDPAYLLHAAPDHLTPQLHHAVSPAAVNLVRAYRHSTTFHPRRAELQVRRHLLLLDSLTWAAPALAHAVTATDPDDVPLLPRWVSGRAADTGILHTVAGHKGGVLGVAATVTCDGRVVAVTGGADGRTVVWDAVTGQRLNILTGHEGRVRAVAATVTPQGTVLAVTAGADGTAVVWDALTGERLHTLTGHEDEVQAVAATALADGRTVAVTGCANGEALVWDLLSGERLHTLTGNTEGVTCAALSTLPDGVPVAVVGTAGPDTVLWDLTTGDHLRTLTADGFWIGVASVAVLPDRHTLAVVGRTAERARVWDLVTGEKRPSVPAGMYGVEVVASGRMPDGSTVAVFGGTETHASVRDISDGQEVQALTGHRGRIDAMALANTPDGRAFVVTGDDQGTARSWHLTQDAPGAWAGHTGDIRTVATAVLPGGRTLALSGGDDALAILWDAATGSTLHILANHGLPVHSVALAVLDDGRVLGITSSAESSIMIWDLTPEGQPLVLREPLHSFPTDDYAWWPAPTVCALADGRSFVGSDYLGPLSVLDPATGARTHTAITGSDAVAGATLVDGVTVVVTAAADGTVTVSDVDSGERLHTLVAHDGKVTAIAATELPGGGAIAVTAGGDSTAVVWDLTTGERLHTLVGHQGALTAVATTRLPDDTLVAVTTGEDRTAIVWNLETGAQQYVPQHLPAEGHAVAGTPEGFMIAYGADLAHLTWNPATATEPGGR
ncbi:AAA family ATPase [Streptomyces sp. NPDC058052]|uniref:AAA family ATPase n=1 Tax=Streptomyces sp. NPDC058052 TaxID=3346316 RepID=UPI0036E46272